jgi:glycosyltransferase involved in cell wall biosynthesis
LLRSVGSALNQTVTEIEILIVGDGPSPDGRTAALELVRGDPRVTFLDNPKGKRHGEDHRHAALLRAQGEAVLYLCDDDLWHPHHVATMLPLLAQADFAHTMPFGIAGDGEPFTLPGDLSLPESVRRLQSGENFIPLTCCGHTLTAYRAMERGWHPAPEDLFTDVHFYQLFIEHGCALATGRVPTSVHFPSPSRTGWTAAERLAELDRWLPVLADRDLWADAVEQLLAVSALMLADATAQLDGVRASVTWRTRERLMRSAAFRAILAPLVRRLAGSTDR